MRGWGERAASLVAATGVAVVLAAASAAPAGAVLDVFTAYGTLLLSQHVPRALVPTALPPVFGGLRAEMEVGPERHGGYFETFAHVIPAVHEGAFPHTDGSFGLRSTRQTSLAALRRRERHRFRIAATRVRGQPALSFYSHAKSLDALVWNEEGHTYELASATIKTIPPAQLAAVAAGADHLVGDVSGGSPNGEGGEGSLRALLTERFAILEPSWGIPCNEPGQPFTPSIGGSRVPTAAPLSGGAFSVAATFPPAEPRFETVTTWTVAVSGTMTPAGGQATLQVSGDLAAKHCAGGPWTFALAPNPFP